MSSIRTIKRRHKIIKTRVGIGKKYGVADNTVKKWMMKI